MLDVVDPGGPHGPEGLLFLNRVQWRFLVSVVCQILYMLLVETFSGAVRASGVVLAADSSTTADEANEDGQDHNSEKKGDGETHFGHEFFGNGFLWGLNLGTDEEDLIGIGQHDRFAGTSTGVSAVGSCGEQLHACNKCISETESMIF